jgi:zinc transport system substrate-binding protein
LLSLPLLIALFGLVGCGGRTAPDGAAADPPDGGRLSVCASFYPMYDFAQKIGGQHATVTNIVPPGMEPHDWEPSVTDIARLEGADILILNGLGIEHWAKTVLQSLENKNLIVVTTSDALTPRESATDGQSGGAAAINGDGGDEDGEGDPHVWLDPMNAKAQMSAIKDAFARADPAHQNDYEANFTEYADKLDALDREFRHALADAKSRDIIVAHQSFGYLCTAYGLTQTAIEGLSPDSEPSPRRMAEIIDFAKTRGVRVIFFEELVDPKVARAIADAAGVGTLALNPLESLGETELAAGEDYFSIMRKNLSALVAALC